MNIKLSSEAIETFKLKATAWADRFDVCCIMDNNSCLNACGLGDYELLVAAGSKHMLETKTGNAFEQLKSFLATYANEFCFGLLGYDLKNEIEKLQSAHPNHINFPDLMFFIPQHVLVLRTDGSLEIKSSLQNLYNEITGVTLPEPLNRASIKLTPRVSKENYMATVERIKHHIVEGDVYELNYCVEFYSEAVQIQPLQTYFKLKQLSSTPFGAYLKINDKYLLCASPERFIKKCGHHLYSQPIKGTAPRGRDKAEDETNRNELLLSEKERAENLMIVDLVRNDLARSAKTGSIKVEELYGIYSFAQVHQMVSTVSARLHENTHPVDAIKNAFPMGSMTGAPKVMAMKLIEQYENTGRGLYSGALGYLTPDGDFDFNVVIRSIQYNSTRQYLNFEVGSAITFDSDAAKEYDECLWKAKAMMKALNTGNELPSF